MYCVLGTSLEGIQLLNRYLEITGDVQSCSLIAIRAFTPTLLQENQVQVWITRYYNKQYLFKRLWEINITSKIAIKL